MKHFARLNKFVTCTPILKDSGDLKILILLELG